MISLSSRIPKFESRVLRRQHNQKQQTTHKPLTTLTTTHNTTKPKKMPMTCKPSSGPTTRATAARLAKIHDASTKISSVWRGFQERKAFPPIRRMTHCPEEQDTPSVLMTHCPEGQDVPSVWSTMNSFWDRPYG
jgi:hypothetical protein